MPHILVLEAYPPTSQALAAILEREGWEVTLAQSGQKTLEALQCDHYDALLIDLDVVTGDGWRLLERLQAINSDTPIMTMVGAEEHHIARAQSLGAHIVLTKPVGRQGLVSGAERILLPQSC